MGGSAKTPAPIRRSPVTPEDDNPCPRKFKAVISGPARGIQAGTWLDVILEPGKSPAPIVFVDPASGAIMGSLIGIPNLATVRDCLTDGVRYRAHVEAVTGGRVDVTVIRH